MGSHGKILFVNSLLGEMIHWSIVELRYGELLWWQRTERDVYKRHETILIEDGLPLMQYYGVRLVATDLDHTDYICQTEADFLCGLHQTLSHRTINLIDHCLIYQILPLLMNHNEPTSNYHDGSLTPKSLNAQYVVVPSLSGCGSITAGNADGLSVVIVLHTASLYPGNLSSIHLAIQNLAFSELDLPI